MQRSFACFAQSPQAQWVKSMQLPFVLSWSMLEAMSAGCLVIGSDTAPVREVLRNGENGLLVDFFSPAQMADRVDEVLGHPDRMRSIREAARQSLIDRYEVRRSLRAYQYLIGSLLRPRVHEVKHLKFGSGK